MWVLCIYIYMCSLYRENYNRHFLKLPKTNQNFPEKPWMTPGLLKSCLRKERLYVRYKKRPSVENWARYVTFRKLFTKLSVEAEHQYYEGEFAKYSQDMRLTWKTIKSLITGSTSNYCISLFLYYMLSCKPIERV